MDCYSDAKSQPTVELIIISGYSPGSSDLAAIAVISRYRDFRISSEGFIQQSTNS